MQPHIFLGPSLPLEQARQHLDAIYLPPAGQGDVASLVASGKAEVIGIIDGFFEGVRTVWHKEILLALSKGIRVVGAASMGALRAAELHPFGMLGVGQIFEWYRQGQIDADDEVTVIHAPADMDYRPLSVALVNMRATFAQAVLESIISEATSQRLSEAGRSIFYADRCYKSLFQRAASLDIESSELAALQSFVKTHAVDQKKLDAICALKLIGSVAAQREPSLPNFELQRTTSFKDMIDRDHVLSTACESRVTSEHVVNHARLSHPNFGQLRRELVDEEIILRQGRTLGVRIEHTELQAGVDQFRRVRGLLARADVLAWLDRNRLSSEGLAELVERQLLIRKTRALCSRLEYRCLLDRLRLDGIYESMEQSTLESERAPEAEGGLNQARLSERELCKLYCERRGRPTPVDLGSLVDELGFADRTTLVVELEKYRCRHGVADPRGTD